MAGSSSRPASPIHTKVRSIPASAEANACYRLCENIPDEGGYVACQAHCDRDIDRCFDTAYSPYRSGYGYGYQWWTYPGATYGAQGIFGQAITIVPQKKLVVAVISNWPAATSSGSRGDTREVVMKIAGSLK
ncbi:MAG: serine hydrolase [Sphingomonadales bacterium]|nr:serine hydrolase [Sphingomonadales bacterium]